MASALSGGPMLQKMESFTVQSGGDPRRVPPAKTVPRIAKRLRWGSAHDASPLSSADSSAAILPRNHVDR